MHDSHNQLYVYAITIWDSIDAQPIIDKYFRKIAKRYIYQLEECPSTGTNHFQCYVNLKTKKRITELIKMFNSSGFSGADISPASSFGKESLKDYCMKEDSRLDGPWADKPIYLGRDLIKQLRPWQQDIVQKLDRTPHKRIIDWYYDDSGGKGKSSIAKYLYFHHNIITLSIGKASDLLNLVFKLQGKKMYIFDISRTVPKGAMNEIYMALECVKNGYFVNTKYDTGVCCMEIPHVVVFSNHLPKLSALSKDRWKIYDLSQMSQDN